MGASTLFQGPVRARDAGLRLLMSVIFTGSGTVVALWGVSTRRMAQRSKALASQNPDQPWLWREDWARGSADAESRSQFLTYGLMGILFILISSPALLNLKHELAQRHNYAILIALIFPLAGLYLISQAVLGRIRARKFGAVFRMAQVPAVAGGPLRGRIETKVALPPSPEVDLTLSCVRSYTSDGRDRWEDILWQGKTSASATLGPLGSTVPVDFEIPFDSRETDSRNPNDEVVWRLTAVRKLPGVDFKVSFQVPVFKTAASDQSITTQKIEDETLAHLPATQPAGSKIRVAPAPEGGLQYYLGPARNKSVAAALMAFGLIFGAAAFFFGFVSHEPFGWLIGAIPILVGVGVGVLLLLFSLSLWLSTTTIRIANQELHVKSTFLGIARNKMIPAAQIQKFELYPGMRSSNQVWYDLRVMLSDGSKLTAGSGLEKREAEWLEIELQRNLGLSQTK